MKTLLGKAAAVILCLAALMCVLAGCGSEESSSASQTSQTTASDTGSSEVVVDFEDLE